MTETVVRNDTILMETDTGMSTIVSQIPVEREYIDYHWSPSILEYYKEKVVPAQLIMAENGYQTYVAIGGASQEAVLDFNEELGGGLTIGTADEVLLKTIIRSNPGFLLVRDGVILNKWHYNSFSVEGLVQAMKTQQ